MFDQITKAANEATTTLSNNVADAVNGVELSEQFTSTTDQVLDAVLDVNRRVVDLAVTTADRVSDQIELPFADSLPTPTEAGERSLDFVERAVSINRDINQRVAEMIAADHAQTVAKKVSETATSASRTVSDTATNATKTVSETATNATKAVSETATNATKTIAEKVPTRTPAKPATAKKATAKKAPAKKTAAKETTAKKASAKKAPAKKATTSK